ncbi:MAG TPA: hypothetical protein VLO11_06290, partial [Luteolibacter sp.]|nr:hypothetical protein [Luteolibacter sp.]
MKPIAPLFLTAILSAAAAQTLAPVREAFWHPDGKSRIVHRPAPGEPPAVVCMQGRKVVIETKVDAENGFSHLARFFEIPAGRVDKTRVEHAADAGRIPAIRIDGEPYRALPPTEVGFNGMLDIVHPPQAGVTAKRTVYPSMTRPLVIEEWTLRNTGGKPVKIEAEASREEKEIDDTTLVVWRTPGAATTTVSPGGSLAFHVEIFARLKNEADPMVDVAAEREARQALADAAWRGPGRLETPEPELDMAFAFQKLHVLECPIDTIKGTITHNGSLRYSPGVWANDPVEYSSPLFPFFGDAQLNEAAMNMYRIWLDYCRKNGIDPFPGSFEHAELRLVQRWRGDDAMVLYGLSKFLLFLGDRKAAEEMWPLIEFSAESIKRNTRADGVVASKTDEMEGRYPTGDANLSTSSLAYGGYRLAASLGRSLGKPQAAEFDQRADALRDAIAKFFHATVEGFDTYRYYEGNTTLRGWILLPPAMGIMDRLDGTLDAMLSEKLWPGRLKGTDILAESTRDTEWGRETYYALRTLFLGGRTEQAIETTRRVVRAQIFGPRGHYPDEDATDMLCPGSL